MYKIAISGLKSTINTFTKEYADLDDARAAVKTNLASYLEAGFNLYVIESDSDGTTIWAEEYKGSRS